MREIVELFFSLVEGFFEFNSDDEKTPKKVRRIFKGVIIFLILMTILITFIVFSNETKAYTITRYN